MCMYTFMYLHSCIYMFTLVHPSSDGAPDPGRTPSAAVRPCKARTQRGLPDALRTRTDTPKFQRTAGFRAKPPWSLGRAKSAERDLVSGGVDRRCWLPNPPLAMELGSPGVSATGEVPAPARPRIVRQLAPAGRVFEGSDGEDFCIASSACEGMGAELGTQDGATTSRRVDAADVVTEPSHPGATRWDGPLAGTAPDPSTASREASASPAAELVPSPRWGMVSSSSSGGREGGTSAATAATPEETPLSGDESRTTVMLQRIPPTLNTESVQRTLDSMGYAGRYDAVNVPMNRGSNLSMRYAFVNFVSPADAARCIRVFTGKHFHQPDGSTWICNAEYARSQGAEAAKAKGLGPRDRGARTRANTGRETHRDTV